MELSELVDCIAAKRIGVGRPIVVGISGFCGSGKSTLARQLVELVPGSVRMRGDDFLDPSRSHRRSDDWDGVERTRLVAEVMAPFREGRPGMFRRYDWSLRRLAAAELLPPAEVLVVDAIGLFHPESRSAIDLAVWCDVDLQAATERGMTRDERLGRNHEDLWNNVWVPNERDFAQRFAPRAQADALFSTV